MNYEYISVPSAWLSYKTYDDIELYQEDADEGQELLTYCINNNNYIHSKYFTIKKGTEWLCNSEDEFLEKVQLAKLERLL